MRCSGVSNHHCACTVERALQNERLQKAWRREHTRFKHDYNDKLYNGLVLLLLVDILVFRFVIKFSILETLGWVVFLFLQVGKSDKSMSQPLRHSLRRV